MGATQSANIKKNVTDIATSATMESVQRCVTSANQEQIIKFGEVTGDFTIIGLDLRQTSSINSTCLISNQTRTDILNRISLQLEQYAKSKGGFGITTTVNYASVYQKLSNTITVSNISEAYTNSVQRQFVGATKVGGNVILKDVSMEQSAKVIAKNILNNSSVQKVLDDVSTSIDQSAKAEGIGLDIPWLYIGIGIVILILIIALIYLLRR